MIAIRTVKGGKTYLSPGVSEKVVNGYLDGRKSAVAKSPWESLTAREREILKLIAEGKRNKDIASYLCVSVKTVEKHRSNLMSKLDLHNASELTSFAIARGLVQTQ
jgi:DNA-binding NarL/FixJ family response regulator